MNGRNESKSIIIDDDVWIGERSIICKGVTTGKGAIVASGSVITNDGLKFSVVAGNPAVLKKIY